MSAEHQQMVRDAWSLIPWSADLYETARDAVVLGAAGSLSLAAAAVTLILARRSAR